MAEKQKKNENKGTGRDVSDQEQRGNGLEDGQTIAEHEQEQRNRSASPDKRTPSDNKRSKSENRNNQ